MARILLDGELSIYTAASQKSALLNAITESGDAEIDLSAVFEIDTAGLQLLLLATREAARQSCRLAFLDHSSVVLEALKLTQLLAVLGPRGPAGPQTADLP